MQSLTKPPAMYLHQATRCSRGGTRTNHSRSLNHVLHHSLRKPRQYSEPLNTPSMHGVTTGDGLELSKVSHILSWLALRHSLYSLIRKTTTLIYIRSRINLIIFAQPNMRQFIEVPQERRKLIEKNLDLMMAPKHNITLFFCTMVPLQLLLKQ